MRTITFSSPLGWVLMGETSMGICLIEFLGPDRPHEVEIMERTHTGFPHNPAEAGASDSGGGSFLLGRVQEAVLAYLEKGKPFQAFPLDVGKGTPFQQEVWSALCRIPFGETRSYLDISLDVGRPRATRAVGQACAKNPIPILIPCHRALATGGKLGGYSGGLHIKEALLNLEIGRIQVRAEPPAGND